MIQYDQVDEAEAEERKDFDFDVKEIFENHLYWSSVPGLPNDCIPGDTQPYAKRNMKLLLHNNKAWDYFT